MVIGNVSNCPDCGGELKHYDKVKRIIRTKGRAAEYIDIQRVRCVNYGKTHRELPRSMIPYKQYSSELIKGVLDGYITPETLGYEDYPCEATMARWIYTLTSQLTF